jgi:hypothetical protein
MSESQNYNNHVKKTPGWVSAVFLILLANILWSAYRMVSALSPDSVIAFLVSIALVAMAFVSRIQTLTVQNRVIRLEERLRYRELLPRDVAARASALPIAQIIALRFASDAELPGLVNEVLAGQLASGKDIKLKVKNWQADFLRA